MYGRIVDEAGQCREPSGERDHGDDAPFLSSVKDRVSLDSFFSVTLTGSFDGHSP